MIFDVKHFKNLKSLILVLKSEFENEHRRLF